MPEREGKIIHSDASRRDAGELDGNNANYPDIPKCLRSIPGERWWDEPLRASTARGEHKAQELELRLLKQK